MTKEELMKRTGLSEENAEILKRTEQMLPMMAELAGADCLSTVWTKRTGLCLSQPRQDRNICRQPIRKVLSDVQLSKRTNRRFTGRSRRELLYGISKQ